MAYQAIDTLTTHSMCPISSSFIISENMQDLTNYITVKLQEGLSTSVLKNVFIRAKKSILL